MDGTVGDGHSATRGAALNGAAIASMAAGSGFQLALYLGRFGETRATDAMIAALAVYSTVSVVGQFLRTTAVPLVSRPGSPITGALFGWTMATLALLTAVVCGAFAEPLAHLVAHASGARGISVATTALRVMAPAIGLQIAGAGLAVIAALRGRMSLVAYAYIGCSVTGVAGYFALDESTRVQVLAWANVISGATVIAVLASGLRVAPARPAGLGTIVRAGRQLLHSIALPMSFILMYPMTLALVPRGRAGEITLFGLAYTVCLYLSGITAQALSMSDIVSLTRLERGDVATRSAVVVRAFRYSLLLAAPGAGVAALAGGPLLVGLMPARVGGSGSKFGVDMLLLAPFLVASLGVWVTMPALLSSEYGMTRRRLVAITLALLAIHAIATLTGRALWGFDGAAVAMVVAPVVFVCFGLLAAAPGTTRLLIRPATTICGMSAISFGLVALLTHQLAHTPRAAAGIVAAAVGLTAYLALVSRAYPDESRTIARLAAR
jgi:hypothetical protein